MPLPTVAIIGRPNVGKSTLFNRLVGKRVALVDDRPGVTRDRREGEGQLLDLKFRVMDTAGFEDQDAQSLPGRMRAQTDAAVREADVGTIARDVVAGRQAPFDAVTARSFGPPERTLRLARQLVADGGRIVISEPPSGERWDPHLLGDLGLVSERIGPVRVFHVKR